MTIDETQEEIIKELEKLNGVMEKYNYLIQLGRKWPSIDPKYKTEDNLIRGCQVTTWYHSMFREGRLFFEIDSLSAITKGFIALLIRIFSGQKPKDIKETDLYFIGKIDLQGDFSPLRANSLFKLVSKIKSDADFYLSKQNNE